MGAHRMRVDWPQFKKDQLVSCGGQTWGGDAFLRRTKCFGERIFVVTGWASGLRSSRVPPLREPTRSQEVNAKKKRGLASVGMTI